jgi:pimeloyl-ACP methyl ester carboxylesterase
LENPDFAEMTATLRSDFIQIGDEPVHYVSGGQRVNAGDVPIVLVHGLAGNTTWWARNVEPLCRLTEVYALDLPGFGLSRTQKPFSIEAQLEAFSNWLSALKLQRTVVIGHSLGGYLAALLAARSPELVAGLVLVDPAIFPPDYGWARLGVGLLRAPFHLSLNFIPTLFKGSVTAGSVTLVRAARDLLNCTILNELGAIRVQTLLLWGNADTIVPPALGAIVKTAMPGLAIGPIELRGGHVAMWDDPEGFNNAVTSFASQFHCVTAARSDR